MSSDTVREPALVATARELAADLVGQLSASNASKAMATTANATALAARVGPGLFSSASMGGNVVLPLSGLDVVVGLPKSIFDSLGLAGDLALVLTAFADGGPNTESEGVHAVVSIELVKFSKNEVVNVSGLDDPIRICMPTNFSAGLGCAYWDEQGAAWSTAGVNVSWDTGPGGPLICETSHLSLFGAILRGMVSALTCSQATLLNADSMANLAKGDWYAHSGAVALWCVVGALLVTFVAAAVMDCRRQGAWSDEHFLVPLRERPAEDGDAWSGLAAEDNEVVHQHGTHVLSMRSSRWREQVGTHTRELKALTLGASAFLQAKEQEPHPEYGRRARGFARRCCCAAFACFAGTCVCLRHSSAARDATDDVLSRWVSYFAEIRDFLEGFYEGLDLGYHSHAVEGRGRLGAAMHRLMSSLALSSARRSAGASVWVSGPAATFVLHDEALHELIVSGYGQQEMHGETLAAQDEDVPHSAWRCGCLANAPSRMQAWASLHQALAAQAHRHVDKGTRWRSLPRTVAGLLLVQSPFGAALAFDIFAPCKMRALFLALDIMGALLLSTVFFAAAGAVGGKRSHANCAATDAWAQVGRLAVIGLASIILAGLPVIFLQSLRSRGLRKVDYEGCETWKRQLRVWRFQDKVIWVLGTLYLCAAVLFICLILANIDPADHKNWAVGAAINVLEDTIAIPLAVALMVPILSVALVSINSWWRGLDRSQLLKDVHLGLEGTGRPATPEDLELETPGCSAVPSVLTQASKGSSIPEEGLQRGASGRPATPLDFI